MAEYISNYTGEEIDAGIAKANTAIQSNSLQQTLANYQKLLKSGVNIKTINDTSILGEGNIKIQGGSNIAIKELDFTNSADFDQETGEPTQAAILDVIANKYFLIHIYNIPINEDVNVETYLIANNMANLENKNNIRYYFKFDEGDESEGTVPNIEQYKFSIEEEEAQLTIENYNLGGGEKSNISVYEFNEADVGQAVLSYIANNKPDLLKITTQDSILQNYCKGQDNEYYCIIDGTLVRLQITEAEKGSYNLNIFRYDLHYIKNIDGADNGTNWTSITIGEKTKNIPSAVTEQTVADWGFTKNTGTYSKPGEGIPESDLAEDVQTSLGKADTALQEHQSLDNYYTKDQVDSKVSSVYRYRGTVSSYANLPSSGQVTGDVYNVEQSDSTHGIKAGDNVAWNGSDWDKLGGDIDLSGYQMLIDSSHKLSSDLVDDTSSTNKFVTAQEKQTWSAKSDFSGSYNDLSDKPTIPDELSDLSDDSTHRLVTDTEKTTWNGKSVVSGTNDGTNWTSLTIDGTTKNISAGGGGSSTDVQINGTSITSSGVANIITETAYNATTNKIATMSDIPDNPLAGKKVSLIGDSITTWSSVRPDNTYSARYPRGVIQTIDQTWWYQMIENGGMTLLRNTAYNGSSCTGRDGGSGHNTASTTDAYAACSNKRINDLSDGTSNPDIVICFIGINDFGSDKNTPTGNYIGLEAVPADSASGMATFSEGYGLMLKKIATAYPAARIYCCTLPTVGHGSVSDEYTNRWFGGSFPVYNTTTHAFLADYNNTIRTIAHNMGAGIIEFAECVNWFNSTTYLEDGLHPNIAGMQLLGDKALAKLQSDFARKEGV